MNRKMMNLIPLIRRLLASALLGIVLPFFHGGASLQAEDIADAMHREFGGSHGVFQARRERRHNSESMQKSIQDRLQGAYLDIEGAGQTIHYDKNTLRVEMVHVDLRPRRSVGGTEIYIEPGAGTSLDVKQLLDAYYSQVGYPDPEREKSILFMDGNGLIVRETRLQGFQKHGWFDHGRRTEAGVWRAATRDNYVQHEQTPEGRHLFKVLHRHESETSPSFHIAEPRARANGGRGIRAADSTAQVSFSSGVEDYLTVGGLYPSVQARIIHDMEMEDFVEQVQRAREVDDALEALRADEGYREYREFLDTRPYDVNTLEGLDQAYVDWQALQNLYNAVAESDEAQKIAPISGTIPPGRPDILADIYLAVENVYRNLARPDKLESEVAASNLAAMAMDKLNTLAADAVKRLAEASAQSGGSAPADTGAHPFAHIPAPANTTDIRATAADQLAARELLADPGAQANIRRLKVQAQRIREMEEWMAYLLSMRERGTKFPDSVLRIQQNEIEQAMAAYETLKREIGWTDAQVAAVHTPSYFSHVKVATPAEDHHGQDDKDKSHPHPLREDKPISLATMVTSEEVKLEQPQNIPLADTIYIPGPGTVTISAKFRNTHYDPNKGEPNYGSTQGRTRAQLNVVHSSKDGPKNLTFRLPGHYVVNVPDPTAYKTWSKKFAFEEPGNMSIAFIPETIKIHWNKNERITISSEIKITITFTPKAE